MAKEPQESEQQKSKRFSPGCFLAMALLLLAYVLSPPFVAWVFGLVSFGSIQVLDAPLYDVFYFPLIALSNHVAVVSQFYQWYFSLFPIEYFNVF